MATTGRYFPEKFFIATTPLQDKGLGELCNTYAYMTRWSDDSSFKKRMGTMVSYAGRSENSIQRLIENKPEHGFQILGQFGGRQSGSNTAYVLDPRGFAHEISQSNLLEILKYSVVDNGEILNTCVWAWDREPHLLCDNSPDFLEAVAQTERLKVKINPKDVKIGNTLELQDGTKIVYLGLWTSLTGTKNLQYSYGNDVKMDDTHRDHYYISNERKEPQIEIRSSMPKISYVVDDSTLTEDQAKEKIYGFLKRHDYYTKDRVYLVKNGNEIKNFKLVTKLVTLEELPNCENDIIIVAQNGKYFCSSKENILNYLKAKASPPNPRLSSVSITGQELIFSRIEENVLVLNQSRQSGYYGSYNSKYTSLEIHDKMVMYCLEGEVSLKDNKKDIIHY